MELSQADFESIIADDSKRIVGDIVWRRTRSHIPAFELSASIQSDFYSELRVAAWHRPDNSRLTLTLLYRNLRIAGLDYGPNVAHTNRDGSRLVGAHFHVWDAEAGSAEAQSPVQFTAGPRQIDQTWRQFCAELRIVHLGDLVLPGDGP